MNLLCELTYCYCATFDVSSINSCVRSADLLLQFKGSTMDDQVMTFWIKRRDKLIHPYSLVGYLLSPNKVIMAHAGANRSDLHNKAVITLIKRLIVNPLLVGEAMSQALSVAINTFWDEFGWFQNKKKMFRHDYMWETRARDDTPAFRWHERNSLRSTSVLGKLACLVLSKILGVGTAERNWKQVKLIKSGQRTSISSERCKKQVTLYGQNQQLKAAARAIKLSSVGKLWEDDDFKTMKMDLYCKDTWQSLEAIQAKGPERMFRNWQETWERPLKNLGPHGDVLLWERLKRKYVGFKFNYYLGNEPKIFTVHAITFISEKRQRKYMIVGVTEDYDRTLDVDDNDNDTYDCWDFNDDTYECFRLYYEEFAETDNVQCWEKDGVCMSEEEPEDE